MLLCVAKECVQPANWKVQFVARPQPHYGAGAAVVELELCFCDKHRLKATLDNLFTPAARRAMDQQFLASRTAAPDWSRSELRFVGLAAGEVKRGLFVYAVYERPSDFPDKFVVRKWASNAAGAFPQEIVAAADSLEQARAHIPMDHVRLPRAPEDDPTIVETWI